MTRAELGKLGRLLRSLRTFQGRAVALRAPGKEVWKVG